MNKLKAADISTGFQDVRLQIAGALAVICMNILRVGSAGAEKRVEVRTELFSACN